MGFVIEEIDKEGKEMLESLGLENPFCHTDKALFGHVWANAELGR